MILQAIKYNEREINGYDEPIFCMFGDTYKKVIKLNVNLLIFKR